MGVCVLCFFLPGDTVHALIQRGGGGGVRDPYEKSEVAIGHLINTRPDPF